MGAPGNTDVDEPGADPAEDDASIARGLTSGPETTGAVRRTAVTTEVSARPSPTRGRRRRRALPAAAEER
ncbi:hypothetical protein ACI792_18960 [Blastococcus sp. SYSU DS0669]